MNMTLKRKLFEPQEIKEMYPITPEGAACKQENDRQIRDVLSGQSGKMLLIIGPCSADHEDSVIDYINRLRPVQDAVKVYVPGTRYRSLVFVPGVALAIPVAEPVVSDDQPVPFVWPLPVRRLYVPPVFGVIVTLIPEIVYPSIDEKVTSVILAKICLNSRVFVPLYVGFGIYAHTTSVALEALTYVPPAAKLRATLEP